MRTQILHWRQRCRNCKVGTAVQFQPGRKPSGLCPVRVTNPPRQSGSGFWLGNEPNRTEPPAKNWTAGGLPRPVANTTSKYFQILPAPPGALQSALRLCKSILTCSWKHLEWWRCIQDAMRLTIRIVKFWSCWNLCAGLRETSRVAEISAQALQETWCHILTPVVFSVTGVF